MRFTVLMLLYRIVLTLFILMINIFRHLVENQQLIVTFKKQKKKQIPFLSFYFQILKTNTTNGSSRNIEMKIDNQQAREIKRTAPFTILKQ